MKYVAILVLIAIWVVVVAKDLGTPRGDDDRD